MEKLGKVGRMFLRRSKRRGKRAGRGREGIRESKKKWYDEIIYRQREYGRGSLIS